MALITVAMTLHMPEVLTAAGRWLDPFALYLASHLITVVDGTALVCVVLMAASKRRGVLLWCATAFVVSGSMVWIFATTQMPRPEDSALPTIYWGIFSVYHFTAMLCCVYVCWRYAFQARDWTLRGGLLALGAGLTIVCLMWVVLMDSLLTGNTQWIGYFTGLELVEVLFVAAGAILPVFNSVVRAVGNLWVYRQIAPLWRDLVESVPHVALGATQSRLGGYPVELRLYRRIIETRDAILTLREYVTLETLEHLRAYLAKHRIDPPDREPTFTACWIEIARRAKATGERPQPHAQDITRLGGDDVRSETAFLLDVARVRATPLIQGLRNQPDLPGYSRT
ncbi:hypothetical protein D5S19_16205 [Amycolatopsis panacis]|uniref:DUF6545 domain-containing protein n=1 Tax=Amycolatopsis panacis TaxID=2340917 RepID=A0A419I3E8_9PSEU|nr:hypothetical protein D5S19_16205 [Amycolatopsis panacis]